MADLGTATIAVAFVLALYAIPASFLGARLRFPALVLSGQRAAAGLVYPRAWCIRKRKLLRAGVAETWI